MYTTLLTLHSWMRWLVLASLLFCIFRAWRGWLSGRGFTAMDNRVRHLTATIAHVQLLAGLGLYFVSPIVRYFWSDTGRAIHLREIRFFGLEHITVMVLAITVITFGSAKAKRRKTDRERFRTLAIWYTAGLLLILSSIPWSFSPLISRPDWRFF